MGLSDPAYYPREGRFDCSESLLILRTYWSAYIYGYYHELLQRRRYTTPCPLSSYTCPDFSNAVRTSNAGRSVTRMTGVTLVTAAHCLLGSVQEAIEKARAATASVCTTTSSSVCPAGLSDIAPMGILRPATPGFLVTLAAAVLLAIVSFSVPYFKSVFFLKASLADEGISGTITFGTLGYCIELSNGTTCSKPSVGYQLGTPRWFPTLCLLSYPS